MIASFFPIPHWQRSLILSIDRQDPPWRTSRKFTDKLAMSTDQEQERGNAGSP